MAPGRRRAAAVPPRNLCTRPWPASASPPLTKQGRHSRRRHRMVGSPPMRPLTARSAQTGRDSARLAMNGPADDRGRCLQAARRRTAAAFAASRRSRCRRVPGGLRRESRTSWRAPGDGDDGGFVAEATRPAGNLGDVQDGIGAVADLGRAVVDGLIEGGAAASCPTGDLHTGYGVAVMVLAEEVDVSVSSWSYAGDHDIGSAPGASARAAGAHRLYRTADRGR